MSKTSRKLTFAGSFFLWPLVRNLLDYGGYVDFFLGHSAAPGWIAVVVKRVFTFVFQPQPFYADAPFFVVGIGLFIYEFDRSRPEEKQLLIKLKQAIQDVYKTRLANRMITLALIVGGLISFGAGLIMFITEPVKLPPLSGEQLSAIAMGKAAADLMRLQADFALFTQVSSNLQSNGQSLLDREAKGENSVVVGKLWNGVADNVNQILTVGRRDFPQITIENNASDRGKWIASVVGYIANVKYEYGMAIASTQRLLGIKDVRDPT